MNASLLFGCGSLVLIPNEVQFVIIIMIIMIVGLLIVAIVKFIKVIMELIAEIRTPKRM